MSLRRGRQAGAEKARRVKACKGARERAEAVRRVRKLMRKRMEREGY